MSKFLVPNRMLSSESGEPFNGQPGSLVLPYHEPGTPFLCFFLQLSSRNLQLSFYKRLANSKNEEQILALERITDFLGQRRTSSFDLSYPQPAIRSLGTSRPDPDQEHVRMTNGVGSFTYGGQSAGAGHSGFAWPVPLRGERVAAIGRHIFTCRGRVSKGASKSTLPTASGPPPLKRGLRSRAEERFIRHIVSGFLIKNHEMMREHETDEMRSSLSARARI